MRRGQRGRRRQGQLVSLVIVFPLAHAHRGNAKAEEAGVDLLELAGKVSVIKEVLTPNLAQLRVCYRQPRPGNRQHTLDAGIPQTFVENPVANHSGCAEQKYFHRDTAKNALAFLTWRANRKRSQSLRAAVTSPV